MVTGDITNHGERQSHLGFIEKLRLLQNQGTRILVIPGNHDINIPDTKAYRGNKATPPKLFQRGIHRAICTLRLFGCIEKG